MTICARPRQSALGHRDTTEARGSVWRPVVRGTCPATRPTSPASKATEAVTNRNAAIASHLLPLGLSQAGSPDAPLPVSCGQQEGSTLRTKSPRPRAIHPSATGSPIRTRVSTPISSPPFVGRARCPSTPENPFAPSHCSSMLPLCSTRCTLGVLSSSISPFYPCQRLSPGH